MGKSDDAHVILITTGGTVASRQSPDGAVPVLRGNDLLGRTNLDIDVTVTVIDLMQVDSSALMVADQFRIVDAVAQALRDPDVTGVVVTHGTDTLEETAYLLDVFHRDDRPVVLTGAQFPDSAPNPDGPANIAGAIACAVDATSRGLGVLVAFDGDVLPARGLFKLSTSAATPFDVVHGELGRPHVARTSATHRPVRVDVLTLYPGVSPGIIAAAVEQNAAGIVLSATGSGNTHPDITAEVSLAVRRGVTVVVSTRVPYGEVVASYGGGGGAVDLAAAGAIVSGWLRAPQARMALIALLSAGSDHAAVERFFAESGTVS